MTIWVNPSPNGSRFTAWNKSLQIRTTSYGKSVRTTLNVYIVFVSVPLRLNIRLMIFLKSILINLYLTRLHVIQICYLIKTSTDEINDAPSVLFCYTPRQLAQPAASVPPLPPIPDPLIPQVHQPAPRTGLPIHPDFTLNDVIFYDEPSPHLDHCTTSDNNSSQSFVTSASTASTQPHRTEILHSRPPSGIYS